MSINHISTPFGKYHSTTLKEKMPHFPLNNQLQGVLNILKLAQIIEKKILTGWLAVQTAREGLLGVESHSHGVSAAFQAH